MQMRSWVGWPVTSWCLSVLCLPLSFSLGFGAGAQSSPEPGQLLETKRCGLGADFHAGRRALLVERLREKAASGLVLVRGLPPTRDYTRFAQDKTFWYLTGIESPSASLLVDVESGATTLFLPKRSKMKEMWEGEVWDVEDEWVRELTGITELRTSDELFDVLRKETATKKLVWISKAPWVGLSGCWDRARPHDRAITKDPLDGRKSREDALEQSLVEKLDVEVRDCAPILAEMRRVKTEAELVAMRRASEIGARAMIEAIRSSRAGTGEWELEAVMTFVHRREGAAGPAYHGITGCGPNALILHYSEVSRPMRAGEMVLLDYAPEVGHYVSDITRSWPVDGEFSPRMLEIYEAVLASQLAGIAAVKPGVTMRTVEEACRKELKKRGFERLLPHGTCHYVGLEVHDAGAGDAPLVPGVVFTVEPGVYDPESGIGVRIEDVVAVTSDGCEVLSALVPKDIESLKKLVREEGLLDKLGPLPHVPRAAQLAPQASPR